MKKSQAQNIILRTSYSALETFKQCPQKFKFQEIDRIRVPKLKEAVFGNIIHETLRFFHSQYPVSPTLDELLNYYKDNWDAKPFQNEQEDMIYFSEGIRILKNYHEYYLKNRDKSVVLDVEARFEFLLEKPEKNRKCILAGKIDRIDKLNDGTLEVIDYKTTKKLPPQSSVDYNLQFSIYCLGILSRWPHLIKEGPENIKLTFHYLKHGETLTTKRDQKQLKEAKEEIWEILSRIDNADFKPIPSALCDCCGYRKICPMWKHLYKEQISINDEQLKNIVNEFFELKEIDAKNNKRLNEIKETINGYLDKEKLERVFGEKGYITRLLQVRYEYDLNKIREIMEPLGGWLDVLTIDSVKLKKIIKTLPKKIQKQIERAKRVDKEYKIIKASVKKVKKESL